MGKGGKQNKKTGDSSVLAMNRSARHEFHLLQTFEAGLVLAGAEVKSARAGRVNLKDAFAKIKNNEVFLHNAHFSPYTHSRIELDPLRPRKCLLHAREIRKLAKELDSGGMTVVATRLYLKQGRIKVELALARGKKLHDKRESIKRRESERAMRREVGVGGAGSRRR